jgi:hypothetical protein
MLTALFLSTVISGPADVQWALQTSMDAHGKLTNSQSVYQTRAECEQARRFILWAMTPAVNSQGGVYRAGCVAVSASKAPRS